MKPLSLHLMLCLAFLPACAGRVPENIGVHDGRLAPCPDTPNCVSSMEAREEKRVPPLVFREAPVAAMDCLAKLVQEHPRAEILQRGDGYLHVAFASRVFGFVDDVEFLLDADQGVIQLRSAARLGHYDFGVNRKRAEELRKHYAASCGGGE